MIRCRRRPATAFPARAPLVAATAVVLGVLLGVPSSAAAQTGTITGKVTNAVTAAPVTSGLVELCNVSTRECDGVSLNATGTYTAIVAVGTYVASARAEAHINEIFDDLLCIGDCDTRTALGSGTPMVVTAGAVTKLDFTLDPGATISGTVSPPPMGGPQSVRVDARARVGSKLVVAASANPTAAGAYTLTGLPTGSYVVATESSQLVDEVYNDRACAVSCQPDEIGAGDRVSVTPGSTVSNVDFGLGLGGSISGTIREAGTGTPVAAKIQLVRPVGSTLVSAAFADANSSGAFAVAGLAAGTYFMLATSGAHVPELFGGVHCLPCTPEVGLSGTPVTVTNGANTPGINVVLDRAATIRGTIRRSPSNAPVGGVEVTVFRGGPTPQALRFGRTDSAGAYLVTGLPAGTYYVATNAAQLDNQVYNGVACRAGVCSAAFATASGTGISVAAGGTMNNVDFFLGAATGPPGPPQNLQAVNTPGGVQFTWSAPTFGGAPTGYLFDAGLTAGSTFATIPVPSTSFTVPGVPPGTYFVRVRALSAAGAGVASSERTLRVSATGVVAPDAPTNVTPILSGGRLQLTWTAPRRGAAPSSYVLEAGSAAGLSNIAVLPLTGQRFLFDGVPPGYYFLRLRSVVADAVGPPSADVMMVAGDVAAPPSEPTSLDSRVDGNVVTLSWDASIFGPVTSYVLEAGSAPGTANLAVFNTGSAATSLVVPGVPSGTYYLRLRALNAQGRSPLGPEHTLVVP